MQRWGPQAADRAGKPIGGDSLHFCAHVIVWDSDKSFKGLLEGQEVISLTTLAPGLHRHTGCSVTWECSKGCINCSVSLLIPPSMWG